MRQETDCGLEHGSAHDHADNGAAVCSQGHADTDLRGATGNGVGGDSIETEGGEEQGQDAEENHEAGDHAVLDEEVDDLLVKGLEFDDGEVRIDGSECLAGERLHVVHGAFGLDNDGASVEAGILLDWALACGLWYALGQWG